MGHGAVVAIIAEEGSARGIAEQSGYPRIPLKKRPAVLGIYYFLAQETAGVATPLVGRVIDSIGPSASFLLIAAMATLLAVFVLLFRHRI